MDLLNLTEKQLEIFKSILREYPNLKCCELKDLIVEEENRRSLVELSGEEIMKKYLLGYVRYELCDGLGSYEVWKVARIDDYGNKTYSLYPDKTIVSNIDGMYSIDVYSEDVVIETLDDLKRITPITKEEYDAEFQKAIEYYKSLKTN